MKAGALQYLKGIVGDKSPLHSKPFLTGVKEC